MIDCPDLVALESAPDPAVVAHVAACTACRLLTEVVGERNRARAVRELAEECARMEILLAAREDDTLAEDELARLDAHLRACAGCTALVETLPPQSERDAPVTLPAVNAAAYALGREVARGGMGRIFDAVDVRIGRRVAVKELLAKGPSLAARFEREARITARLQHPGIVPIYEIGRWPDGTPFYVMRMVEGGTLRDAIRARGKLGDRLGLLSAVIAAADAVAFAHAQRIIHRDLTPANVLVGAYGETVVIDWGLAKDLDVTADDEPDAGPFRVAGNDDGELTGPGAVVGTAAYMPPEQAMASSVDERADVYALGAILYHVLAGVPPYRAATSDALLREVKTGPPPALEDIVPAVSRDLVSIVGKAMAREPSARYPSARELADELKRFQVGRMVEAHAYTTLERMRRFVARNRAPLIVTAAGVLALALVGGLAVSRVVRERGASARTVTTLLEEKGRTELLAGAPLRALAFLAEAYQRGDSSTELRFMLASAMREVDSIEATLDCGDDVRMIDVSPDGRDVAAACRDVGKIWRLSDHALVATLGPFPRGFDGLRYAHDGRTLVSEGLDGHARLFSATGALLLTLEHAPDTRITRASFTPDDKLLVTTGFDGWARVWNLATHAQVRAFAAGELGLLGVHGTLTPDGKTLLTVTLGGTGTGWDVATGEKLASLEHGSQILGGDISPDSALACTPGVDRRVKVWDLAARAAKYTLAGHSDVVWKCVFSPDSKRLVTSGNDGTAKVWDLATGSLVTSVAAGDIVWSDTWSPDGQRIATSSLDGSLKVWDATTGALLASHDDPYGGKMARFSVDGTQLITARGDGRIRIWRESGNLLRSQLAAPAGGKIVGASSDGTRAVVAGAWGNLEIWNAETGKPLAHAPLGEPFALSADARWLAARAQDRVVVLDLRDGHTIATLPIAAPSALALDRTGARLLATTDGDLAVWDVARATPAVALPGAGTHALLADDGNRVLAWSDAAPPVLWDVRDEPHELVTLAVNRAFRPIGFSHDGTRIALHQGSDDSARTASVWSDDGRMLASARVANDGARLDPGGELLTTVGPDNVVRVLRMRDGELAAQFIGEHMSRAQTNAAGDLVVAIDKLGANVLVLSARDGRIVAQQPILHPPLTTTQDTFVLPDAAAWWTGDGATAAIVTMSGSLSVWAAHLELRDPDAVARAMRAYTPWRIQDGRLELLSGHVRGHVTHDQHPVPGASVAVAIREVPRMPAAMSWTTTMSRVYAQTVTTDASGDFEVANLVPGEYSLVVRSDAVHASSGVVDLRVSDLEAEIEVELHDDGARR